MSQTEEIKSKLDIVEVIREYLPVKAVGVNFQALCPFHNEKTPSFVISPDKQVWHCFGCGRGGDVFSFVMEKEGLSFPEALRLLANKAGVVLKHENVKDYSERNRLLDIMELAAKYYAHLLAGEDGSAFRAYLSERGLTEETIAAWRLGYSRANWDDLFKFLQSRPLKGKKFSSEEIFSAGLAIKKNTGLGYYDRFRDRIMFPIWDVNNNVIAFTARANPAQEKSDKLAKYINSPQTKVYDKSRVLFGLNKAKQAIRQADLAIVVEGQMDVIACHQHGFENVVASSGTALTAEQITLLKRFSNNLALLFDMDQAGQLAADRGIREALAQEMNLQIIVLSVGKDPADALNSDPEAFRQAVSTAKPMLAYYFEKIRADLDLSKLENKRLISAKMFAMISLVANKTEQGHWLKKISEELDFFEPDTREEFLKWQAKNKAQKAGGLAQPESAGVPGAILSREEKLAERLLALLLRFPEFVNYSVSNFEPEDMPAGDPLEFYKNLIIYYNKAASLDYESFRDYLIEIDDSPEEAAPEKMNFLNKLVLLGEKDFYDYEAVRAKAELVNIISELKKYSRRKRIQILQKELSQAEQAGRSEDVARLMEELKNLTSQAS